MKEEPISIIDQAEQYVKTNTELYTLRVTDKVATVLSSLLSRLIIGLLAFLVLFMMTMGLAFWIGDLMGHDYLGFLIVGGVTGVITLIIYVRRYTMIKKPVMDTIIAQILK